jgi:fatty acid desaturase
VPKATTLRAENAVIKLSQIEGAKAYAQLKKDVEAAGILDRAYGYYLTMSVFAFGGFFLTIYLLYVTTSLALAAVFGLIFTFFTIQLGGLFHDAGHRAIFKSSKLNDIIGHIIGFLVVDSIDAWMRIHNKHHANTNEVDEDPDLEIPLHSFATSRFAKEAGFYGIFKKYQAYTYFPVRCLIIVTKRVGSFVYLSKNWKSAWWKMGFLTIGLIIWYVLPFVYFDLSKTIVIFLTTSLPFGFYLANIFAPNHKGMPEIKKGTKISFMEQAIITSRNLKGGFLTELFFNGLNYQIEHHLFTECPRNKLKLITPYAKNICKQYGLEYTEVGIIETNKIILHELNQVAATS